MFLHNPSTISKEIALYIFIGQVQMRPQQGDFPQSLDTDGGKRTLYIYSYENNIYILRLVSLFCDIDGGL